MKKSLVGRLIAALVLILALVITNAASQRASENPIRPVSVPFFVEDGHGKPVATITGSDLAIVDDKEETKQIVGVRAAREIPLRLGVVIDTRYGPLSVSITGVTTNPNSCSKPTYQCP